MKQMALAGAAGAEFDLMSFLVSRYFGAGRYGVVYSNLYAAFKIAAGVAAPLYGRAFDVAGSYSGILYVAAGAILVGVVEGPDGDESGPHLGAGLVGKLAGHDLGGPALK